MPLPLLSDGREGQQEYVDDRFEKLVETINCSLARYRDDIENQLSGLQTQIDTMRQAFALAAGTVERVSLGSIPVSDPRLQTLERWEAIKRKLGGKEAEVIDVLMHSGPRTNTQLKPLLKLAYSTVCALTQKMSNMGFLTKQGDAWALREN